MRKTLKILLAFALVFAMAFSLGGCSPTKKAESVVDSYLTAFKEGDTEQMQKYMEKDEESTGKEESETYKDNNTEEIFSSLAKRMDYEILDSEKIDDSTVTVKVKITNVNMIPVFKEYMELSLGLMFTQNSEEAQKKLDSYIIECIENPDSETVTSEVGIKVKKTDDGWKINPNEEFLNALFGNMFKIKF